MERRIFAFVILLAINCNPARCSADEEQDCAVTAITKADDFPMKRMKVSGGRVCVFYLGDFHAARWGSESPPELIPASKIPLQFHFLLLA